MFLALWLALVPGAAMAQDYPPVPQGPVYDGANMLSPQTVATLDAQLREYNKTTGRAIIVATIPSLDGVPIESYATGLFNAWGIGGKERDQGLLLLVARDDRKMRIEVGYGLHPWFGGIMAGRIIRDQITPRFKQDDYDGGVTAGVKAILDHLQKSPEDAQAIEEAAKAADAQEAAQNSGGSSISGLVWMAFVFFFFILPMIRGRRGRRYRSGMGDAVGNIVLWEAGKAIARGIDSHSSGGGWGGGSDWGGGGGGFGGFGGGSSGGGGASGGW
ncbi:MAG: TPM domain-containing protein [Sphingomonadales bacterium]|nr:TPM domain-containing protein [Sphingomonadales bacterium]MBD3772533.1 TPM domain-containing protein [Paracoccaceae bacterium]